MCVCHSCVPNWEPVPQPRQLPWLEIELGTLSFTGQQSVHWGTPARVTILYIEWLSVSLNFIKCHWLILFTVMIATSFWKSSLVPNIMLSLQMNSLFSHIQVYLAQIFLSVQLKCQIPNFILVCSHCNSALEDYSISKILYFMFSLQLSLLPAIDNCSYLSLSWSFKLEAAGTFKALK